MIRERSQSSLETFPKLSEMQLSLATILLASGFSLEGSNATTQFLGRSAVSLMEEQIRAATPRRLTHRRTVDGPHTLRAAVGQGSRARLALQRGALGRLCASEFTQSGITYSDCTRDVSPGGIGGREWCYAVRRSLGRTDSWDSCSGGVCGAEPPGVRCAVDRILA